MSAKWNGTEAIQFKYLFSGILYSLYDKFSPFYVIVLPNKLYELNKFHEVGTMTAVVKYKYNQYVTHMVSPRVLTHWRRVRHICVSNLTTIGSDNGLSPGRHQAVISSNSGIILIGALGTNFNGILIETLAFSFKKMCFKVSSAKYRPFCLCRNVLRSNSIIISRLCAVEILGCLNEHHLSFYMLFYHSNFVL